MRCPRPRVFEGSTRYRFSVCGEIWRGLVSKKTILCRIFSNPRSQGPPQSIPLTHPPSSSYILIHPPTCPTTLSLSPTRTSVLPTRNSKATANYKQLMEKSLVQTDPEVKEIMVRFWLIHDCKHQL